ncbi:hypothetical protein [Pseudomonas sp. CM25]|uniref:hypothetical protein n=1 Tax=Pseudomonas sp. CM25 TaxID=2738448 RepID=UPI0015B3CB5D|nr:hypothetical protein [Pseudomonas sp. CM25]
MQLIPQRQKPPRRAREVTRYKNPDNREIIATKGSNHKPLKEWEAEYASDEVEGWLPR